MTKLSMPVSNDFCPQTLFAFGTYDENKKPDFGLFCWFSYCWDTDLGVMCCIGGEKLTKDHIHQNGVFSANLVTEELLPMCDYFGNTEGYGGEKQIPETEIGKVLDVPVLAASPLAFELEVSRTLPLNGGEIFLCRIRNVLAEESLAEASLSVEEKMEKIAPVRTTCCTYFGWNGKAMGAWGEPGKGFRMS